MNGKSTRKLLIDSSEEEQQPLKKQKTKPPNTSTARSFVFDNELDGIEDGLFILGKSHSLVKRTVKKPVKSKAPPKFVFAGVAPPSTMLLVDTHSPTSEAELAVHKKKVLAVKTWLQQPFSKILILSGPSGSGKTAVIKTLSKSLGFEILEWESPNNDTALQTKFDECKTYTPLIDTFIEFLYSCGNRSSLPFSSTIPRKQIILVEDVPLIGHSSSRKKFHTAIRNYCTFTRNTTPIVFILSDILCSDEKYELITSVRTLFPPELLLDNRIHQIIFNPIASTILNKALSRIVEKESGNLRRVPTKLDIQRISESSGGDIRCAVNSIQFMYSSETRIPTRKKKVDDEMTSVNPQIGTKEDTLILFHAIGKILNNKRQPSPSHHTTLPLPFNPETIFASAHTSESVFTSFLHQNYIGFYKEIEEIGVGSEYLSLSDTLNSDWNWKECLSEYSSSISMRGLLYAHTYPTISSGLRQIRKPELWKSNKEKTEMLLTLDTLSEWQKNYHTSKSSFKLSHNFNKQSLALDILPYISILSNLDKSPTAAIPAMQRHVLQGMLRFKKGGGGRGDFLNERDLNIEEEEEVMVVRGKKDDEWEVEECEFLIDDDIVD